jgi:type I restriction enzyme, R subunit
MSKNIFSESDVKEKFITPAIIRAGWDELTQIRREVYFTEGRIYVKGRMTARGKRKFADYILYYQSLKKNIPIAIIEAKDNSHTIRSGIQQALGYANTLDIPFVFSSNGEGFYFHDKTSLDGNIEWALSLDSFPSPTELWTKYKKYKGINSPEQESIITQDYYQDGSDRTPRYYQTIAVNRTIEAIAKGSSAAYEISCVRTGVSPEMHSDSSSSGGCSFSKSWMTKTKSSKSSGKTTYP